ncbi:MAG TPA: hypothetical protein VFQ47_05070 [Nitrososphaera sp.]|jgi:hypothetical protein|nr:hypothetical protein [Nitrososphaera sp.]
MGRKYSKWNAVVAGGAAGRRARNQQWKSNHFRGCILWFTVIVMLLSILLLLIEKGCGVRIRPIEPKTMLGLSS